jgi:hypothetical protein
VHQKVNDNSFGGPEPLPFMVNNTIGLILCEATAFVFFATITMTGIVSADFHNELKICAFPEFP